MKIRALILVAVLVSCVGCQATAPPASETAAIPASPALPADIPEPPLLGIDWGRATSVERPVNNADIVDPTYTGTHPILRIPGQATMADVIGLPGGGFTAVGYVPPAWQPAAWTSDDGDTWALHDMGATEFTFPVALAGGPDGDVVAVGRSGMTPVAWSSVDGLTWQRHPVPVLGRDGVAERMTTVVAAERGYVAGGSVGPELLERHARFWTSVDGRAWEPVRDDPEAFANAEVRAIATVEGRFVAVGVVGTAQAFTRAVAWTSPDGVAWTRIEDPAFEAAVAVALAGAPFGGLVAVGSEVGRREAVAWTSPDGRAWTRAPSEMSRQHPGGYAWMTDVVAIDDRVIAIGTFQGLQRGTATSWVSLDGTTWERAHSAPVQQQGEFYAITPGGPGAIVVGSFGAPDSYVPNVWLSPAR